MKSYWFGKEDKEITDFLKEEHIIPYIPDLTLEEKRQIGFSDEHQVELNNDHYTLSNIASMISNMLIHVRNTHKNISLSEKDLEFLLRVCYKDVLIDSQMTISQIRRKREQKEG